MRFWDSSAIIPLCVQDAHTQGLRKLLSADSAMVIWWGTPVECASAFARLRREQGFTPEEETHARENLSALTDGWAEVAPTQTVREQAARGLLLHPLRAADALQLAAALVWSRSRPVGHEFVCLDRRLREAAQREGFILLPKILL